MAKIDIFRIIFFSTLIYEVFAYYIINFEIMPAYLAAYREYMNMIIITNLTYVNNIAMPSISANNIGYTNMNFSIISDHLR